MQIIPTGYQFMLICRIVTVFIIFMLCAATVQAQNYFQKKIADINANVVFMRHALAPGTGDPSNFSITDCSTQRNLSATGRRQAQNIGAYFNAGNIRFTEVLSSEWCRCKDTAQEMHVGAWRTFNGLNSFYQGHEDRGQVLARLKTKLNSLPHDALVLMVTHQVVISAVTDLFASSGGIVLYNTKTGEARAVDIE